MFITFEGIDGSGKSTQVELLAERLRAAGHTAHLFREPGGTPLSERIRALLLEPGLDVRPLTELLLFSAARARLVEAEIRPQLDRNVIVICDRFYDSTTAYQGAGRHVADVDWIAAFNRTVVGGLVPDRTYYLAISPTIAAERCAVRTGDRDRMEQSDLAFYRRVVEAYEGIADAEPHRVLRLDANQPLDRIHAAIWADLQETLGT